MFLDPPALGGGRVVSSFGPGGNPAGMYGSGEKDDGGVEVHSRTARSPKPQHPPVQAVLAEVERWVCQADRAEGDSQKEEALSLVLAVLCGLFKTMLLDKRQIACCIQELGRIKGLPENGLLSEVWEGKGFNPFNRALAELRKRK